MLNLTDSEVTKLAEGLMDSVNDHGVPYFRGYLDHVEALIRQVQLAIAVKQK